MLLVPVFCGFQWRKFTTPNPSTSPGTSITAGADTKGSWGQIAAALDEDVYGFLLWIVAGAVSGAQRDYLIDIGVDPAGGTNYVPIISDILAHQASRAVDCGRQYYFPMFIKAGARVGARAQGNGANTIRVAGIFYGKPTNPEVALVGQYSETIGVSGNGGTSLTPGASGAEGSWVSLGTTTKHLWWWQLCVGFSTTVTTSKMYYFDLAVGDDTNKDIILENVALYHPGTAERTGQTLSMDGFWDVPAGSTLYVRGSCSGATDSGCNALAVGVGG